MFSASHRRKPPARKEIFSRNPLGLEGYLQMSTKPGERDAFVTERTIVWPITSVTPAEFIQPENPVLSMEIFLARSKAFNPESDIQIYK